MRLDASDGKGLELVHLFLEGTAWRTQNKRFFFFFWTRRDCEDLGVQRRWGN